jgi:hypothetical protein
VVGCQSASKLQSILKCRGRTVTPARHGLATLEMVLATAVVLPLGFMLFLLGVQICRYVFRGLGGMLSLPIL